MGIENPNFVNSNEKPTNLFEEYPEVRTCVDFIVSNQAVRESIEGALTSGDPKYGSTVQKIQNLLNGSYTGIYSPDYQAMRQSSAFKALTEKLDALTKEQPKFIDPEAEARYNQASTNISMLRPKIESLQGMIMQYPDDRSSASELAKLRNELEYWQGVLEKKGNSIESPLGAQTQTQMEQID